ncbi:hypothetical protein JGU66_23950 [Myxococcaceae bacterium JPH2]|nr:hypothetical protein [Myxococcaceae bacterium JPH2]
MTTTRFRQRIHPILRLCLATSMWLAGCGGGDVTADGESELDGFSEVQLNPKGYPVLDGLRIPSAPDSIELRQTVARVVPGEPSFITVSQSGETCGTATDAALCQECLKRTGGSKGFNPVCAETCTAFHIVTTQGDDIHTYATVKALRMLLGDIDTAQEATLLVFASGYTYVPHRVGQGGVRANPDGSFDVIANQGAGGREGTDLKQVVLHVQASGDIEAQSRPIPMRVEGT